MLKASCRCQRYRRIINKIWLFPIVQNILFRTITSPNKTGDVISSYKYTINRADNLTCNVLLLYLLLSSVQLLWTVLCWCFCSSTHFTVLTRHSCDTISILVCTAMLSLLHCVCFSHTILCCGFFSMWFYTMIILALEEWWERLWCYGWNRMSWYLIFLGPINIYLLVL